jgi:hypothetical protein
VICRATTGHHADPARKRCVVAQFAKAGPCLQEDLLHQIGRVVHGQARRDNAMHGAAEPPVQLGKRLFVAATCSSHERPVVVSGQRLACSQKPSGVHVL